MEFLQVVPLIRFLLREIHALLDSSVHKIVKCRISCRDFISVGVRTPLCQHMKTYVRFVNVFVHSLRFGSIRQKRNFSVILIDHLWWHKCWATQISDNERTNESKTAQRKRTCSWIRLPCRLLLNVFAVFCCCNSTNFSLTESKGALNWQRRVLGARNSGKFFSTSRKSYFVQSNENISKWKVIFFSSAVFKFESEKCLYRCDLSLHVNVPSWQNLWYFPFEKFSESKFFALWLTLSWSDFS